jgi:hypothetical protein
MMNKLIFCSISILLLSSIAFAQEFEIKKYEIDARVIPEEQKVAARAKLPPRTLATTWRASTSR